MRKATRRKVRSTAMNPVALALLSQQTAKEDLADLLTAEAQAIAALKAGAASQWDMQWLRRMVATAHEMAVAGIGPEVLAPCEAARQALQHIAPTAHGFHLADVTPLAELHRWHQVQREEASAADYVRALDAARRHSRSSLDNRAGAAY